MTTMEQVRNLTNPAFRFVVDIQGITHGVFTECTLPTIDWKYDRIKEGGQNTYIHMLPGPRQEAKITLKNGIGSSALLNWYIDTLNEKFTRHNITVRLLNAKDKTRKPVMTWNMFEAFPVKWSGPQLKSDDNTIAIQTLELACGQVTMSGTAS